MVLRIDESGTNYELKDGEVISIGRKGCGANVEIDSTNVSKIHCYVKKEGDLIKILDNDSRNGVERNGGKITKQEWQEVNSGDRYSIAGYILKFIPSHVTGKNPQLATVSGRDPEGRLRSPDINTKFKELVRLKLPIKIGRMPTNDIVLPDVVAYDSIVSRVHAEITYRDGRYWIEDLGSTNHTYVNDEILTAKQPKALAETDTVLIHLHCFTLAGGYRDLREEVAIRAEGISKKYPNGFLGLNPMSVEIPYKQIVALMGPSGCGKSTLLKALNGDNPATSGNVYIHGLSLRENYKLLKRKIGYVPQDDIIHSELTVDKTLYLAARLRLPDDTPEEEIENRISEVLTSLNFDGSVRHKKVGGLSGGQRKRVCIAVELLSRPTILFLDEPTSPLDPETIEEFLNALQKLAKSGTTIVMVTHKPEDLNYADKVIFMAAQGYFVYYGDRNGLTDRFSVDHIIKIYTKSGGWETEEEKKGYLNKYYLKPAERNIAQEQVGNLGMDKQNSLFLQFYWLTKRYLNIKMNDTANLVLLLAQPFIISGLISFIFHEINISVMMLLAVSAIWFGVSNASKEIVGEFSVYKRERMFNLNIHTYILSKWLVLTLISLVQVIIFVAIIHIRFHSDANLGNYWQNAAFMLCIASSATLLGLSLSAYFSSTEKVLTVVPIVLMPQIMLAGVVEQIKSVHIDVLSYLTLGRWGTEGFLRLQAKDFSKFALNQVYYNQQLKDKGEKIVDLFNSIQANILAIALISAIMYMLTYVSLKKKDTM